MRYISAYPVSYSKIKTKKDLKQAAKEGFNADMQVVDPMGMGSGVMGLNEIPEGVALQVTNHPKRSWFATVTRDGDKVTVK